MLGLFLCQGFTDDELGQQILNTTGRCYCGALKYEINEQAEAAFQCHCRECQYITGGNPKLLWFFLKMHFATWKEIQRSLQGAIFRRQSLNTFAETVGQR